MVGRAPGDGSQLEPGAAQRGVRGAGGRGADGDGHPLPPAARGPGGDTYIIDYRPLTHDPG